MLFVTSADRPFTESERAFLEQVRGWGKKVVIVINKVDILDSPEDVDSTIQKAMEINDVPVVVDFRVHRDAMVWPMVAAGTSNDEIKYARDLAPQFDQDDL